jgi:mRNA deadenylase 3'-5' endonuclease subunit Ccr4
MGHKFTKESQPYGPVRFVILKKPVTPVVGNAASWRLSRELTSEEQQRLPPSGARIEVRAVPDHPLTPDSGGGDVLQQFVVHDCDAMTYTISETALGRRLALFLFLEESPDPTLITNLTLMSIRPAFIPLPVPAMVSRRTDSKLNASQSQEISILSWNILANQLVKSAAAYPWLRTEDQDRTWVLDRGWRLHALLVQIRAFNADVVCLQEVDKDLYSSWWVPEMKSLGYTGIVCTSTQYGEAIFWKHDNLALSEQHVVDYDDLTKELMDSMSDTQLKRYSQQVMNVSTGRCGLVAKLKFVQEQQTSTFFIATTHLWTSRSRNSPFLRILQYRRLTRFVEKRTENGQLAVVCGDFNAPYDSQLYNFASTGKLKKESLVQTDLDRFPECLFYMASAAENEENSDVLSCPIWSSAYQCVLGQEPMQMRKDKNGSVIEYFFSSKLPVAIMPLIKETANQPLPHPMCAADHCPIMAKYEV